MMGFLIDENEFEVTPAISRTFQIIEVDQRTIKRPQKKKQPVELESIIFEYKDGSVSQEHIFEYTCDLFFTESTNVDQYSVFINNEYYGDDVDKIQINNGDVLKIDIVIGSSTQIPMISFSQKLV